MIQIEKMNEIQLKKSTRIRIKKNSYTIYGAISFLRISRLRDRYCEGRGGGVGTPQKIKLAGILNTRRVIRLMDNLGVCLTSFIPRPIAALFPQNAWK